MTRMGDNEAKSRWTGVPADVLRAALETIDQAVLIANGRLTVVAENEAARRVLLPRAENVIDVRELLVIPDPTEPIDVDSLAALGHVWLQGAEPAGDPPARLPFQCRSVSTAGGERYLILAQCAPTSPVHVPLIAGISDDRVADKDSVASTVDGLTGLADRRMLLGRLEAALRRHHAYPHEGFALLFLDLDLFKEVNDRFGHVAGDKLLGEAAQRLKMAVRPGDLAARYGGDEFAILLTDIREPQDALHVAQRIAARMRPPLEFAGQEIVLTVSVGIAMADRPDESAEQMLARADAAMYRAKARGGDGAAF